MFGCSILRGTFISKGDKTRQEFLKLHVVASKSMYRILLNMTRSHLLFLINFLPDDGEQKKGLCEHCDIFSHSQQNHHSPITKYSLFIKDVSVIAVV